MFLFAGLRMMGSLLRKTRRMAEGAINWRQSFVDRGSPRRSVHSGHSHFSEHDNDNKECEYCLSLVPNRAYKCAFCGSTLNEFESPVEWLYCYVSNLPFMF